MRLYAVILWRLLFASRKVHPFYYGGMHQRIPGWRQFLSVVSELAMLPLLLFLWFLTPFTLLAFGVGVFNRTRANIHRLVRLNNHDLVTSTVLGRGGAYWWCLAAAFHLDRNSRSFWRMALLTLILVSMAGTLGIFAFLINITSGEDVLDFLLLLEAIVLGVGALYVELFLAVLFGGLIAIRSALSGVHMGTRLAGMLAYGVVKMSLYFVTVLVLNRAVMLASSAIVLLGVPVLVGLYFFVHEAILRGLWHGIERQTGLTFDIVENMIRPVSPSQADKVKKDER